MAEWLNDTFPPWLLGVIIIGGGALVTWIAVSLRHRRAKSESSEAVEPDVDNDLTEVFVVVVTTMYAVLLAFMIFIVWNNLDRADQAATAEGGTLTALARHSIALPQPDQRTLQEALRTYTESVIHDEWPTLAHSQSSPRTTRLFNHLFVVAARLPASDTSSDITTELTTLSQQRTTLILTSSAALPGVFWFVLILGAVLSIGLCVVFFTETPGAHGLMAVAAAVLFCGGLWLILEVDYPLSGISVKPDAFELVIHVLDTLQNGQL
jgi:hypothetical protein